MSNLNLITGIDHANILYNLSPAALYLSAIKNEKGVAISSTGALMCLSGKRTGRSPKDKRIVMEQETLNTIWWGPVNIPMSKESYEFNKKLALKYLNVLNDIIYVVDVYAGKDIFRKKIRIITSLAYHALFMQNMFEMCTNNDEPDFTIINAGEFPAIVSDDVTSTTSINICFSDKCMIILGTMYAGEMKKGIFSLLHYYYPKDYNILTLHSSANGGIDGDVSVFFGLSGTGKTSLSMDPDRRLICDDELAWYDDGVFNIESGCYAKVINLSAIKEPYIYNAIKFGTVLENVVYDHNSYQVDYTNSSITENTRASYPMSYVLNDNISNFGMGQQPKNIIMLTCDAYGVLPPIAKLTEKQAMYYFISGYTSMMPSTVHGCTEPKPQFSACFGDAFLTLHPQKYAEMLADKIKKTKANVWLVNTGWHGGAPGVGKRYPITISRAIINNIHNGLFEDAPKYIFPIFNFQVPKTLGWSKDIISDIMYPDTFWNDKVEYQNTLKKLADMFHENITKFNVSMDIIEAGPGVCLRD